MRTDSPENDERLLRRLQAPPDLGDGVQSLAYWRGRRQRLPWYHWRARREAQRIILRWEQRVAAALVSQPRVAMATRASAGLLLGRIRLQRWGARAAVAATAIGTMLIAVPIVAVYILAHAV
jgi:hypothetical protein